MSTAIGWDWLYTPNPDGSEPFPYGDDVRWPQPGEVDVAPASVELVGPCDGVGACRLVADAAQRVRGLVHLDVHIQ